ncbi:MAG: NADPH-dependent F420 reductase [Deltaproteobacteria bacterium]|nr:NADPH-dependent F420 reductase [Deltaproteobacteria bacterium]
MTPRRIGIIGGTGPQGRGLALRLALAGHTVRVGSRDAVRGRESAQALTARVREAGAAKSCAIAGGDNAQAVMDAEIVMLTVPYEGAVEMVAALAAQIPTDAVFVDVTVPLVFGQGDVRPLVPPEGSGSQALRAVLPASIPLCGACKTLPAHLLEELGEPLACNTFVFGDRKEAKALLMDALNGMGGLQCLDVGGLSAAATVEGMTALLIRINRRYKSRHGRFSVLGLGG